MSKLYGDFLGGRAAWGLLLLRLVTGVAMMIHGWGKFQQPFNWMNRPGRPPSNIPGWMQAFAAFAEFGGGLALVLGLLMPLACLGIMFTMLGAKFISHAADPWINPGGKSWELASLYLLIATALLFLGPGRFALDCLLFESTKHVSDERLRFFQRKRS
ncbi:MAG TPA: DoxX family protein [Abditibacteriaceae bacterium]